jgi:hypothetical protein
VSSSVGFSSSLQDIWKSPFMTLFKVGFVIRQYV